MIVAEKVVTHSITAVFRHPIHLVLFKVGPHGLQFGQCPDKRLQAVEQLLR